uniref:Uncharacterized protein n=1 Tax=Acrobeloides nanus TaxID=290746 RepID=A0A914CUH7_9BILA
MNNRSKYPYWSTTIIWASNSMLKIEHGYIRAVKNASYWLFKSGNWDDVEKTQRYSRDGNKSIDRKGKCHDVGGQKADVVYCRRKDLKICYSLGNWLALTHPTPKRDSMGFQPKTINQHDTDQSNTA